MRITLGHHDYPRGQPPRCNGREAREGTARGFSLMEMLVVLAVSAVLLTVAIPAFQEQRAKNDVKRGTEDLLALLRQAAAEAPLRDQPMTININSLGSPWCVGVAVDSTCDCTQANDCTVPIAGEDVTRVVAGNAHPRVLITDNFNGNNTTFEPVRGRASNPGTLTVISGGWSLDLRVSTEGRVQVCNPGDNAIPGYEAC
jgi:type IV fimbrial biogenesis protein FimT